MREIFEHCLPDSLAATSGFNPLERNSQDQKALLGGNLDDIAYYTQAVCEREREHMPCIGPSVDRRVLARTTQVSQNEAVQSLICFACAQVFPYVHAWDLGYAGKNHSVVRPADIKYYTVADTLIPLKRQGDRFHRLLSMRVFKRSMQETMGHAGILSKRLPILLRTTSNGNSCS